MRSSTLIGAARAATPGTCIRAAVFALLLLPAAASPAPGGSATAEPQRLSAAGETELRGLVGSGRLESLNRPEFGAYQAEISGFYASGGYALNWVRNSRPTAAARSVTKRLQAAEDEGLPARDYDGGVWADRLAALELPGRHPTESLLLRFDLALTVSAMRYLLDLRQGRINPEPLNAEADLGPGIRGPAAFLRERVLASTDAAAAFSAAEPPFASYRRLVNALQRYRELAGMDDGGLLPVPRFPVRPGSYYGGLPRLAGLLRLLGDLPIPAAAEKNVYTGSLVTAVRHFQRRHGLTPDGVLGARTLRQLNTPLEQRLLQLRLALERWRWLPHRFSRPPVLVNIPEFRLYAGDEPPQKVVVGKAFGHETPVFASRMTEVVFRPPWNVPLSIQLAELVPDIKKDAAYLQKHDFDVLDGKDAVVSTGAVSAGVLARLEEGKLFLRQRPGPKSSLGLVKFQMTNKHSIYIHGTPSRGGFSETRRDLSHGCIRVRDPGALAAWVLRDRPGWTPARIKAAMYGKETVTVKLTDPVPVLIQYGTAAVGEDGEVRFFEDIYSRDEVEGAAFERPWTVALEKTAYQRRTRPTSTWTKSEPR